MLYCVHACVQDSSFLQEDPHKLEELGVGEGGEEMLIHLDKYSSTPNKEQEENDQPQELFCNLHS